LKFDALLGKGEREAAQKLLDDLPGGLDEMPRYAFLAGRAFFEVGELERAMPLLTAAVEKDPENPDAHYYLGLARDEKGDWRGATLAFLEARELDARMPPAPWALDRDEFQ